jgi:hypothetical protein
MPMLEFVRGKASERKLQLLVVACCRRIWNLLADERSRRGVLASERYADGTATRAELHRAGNDASAVTLNFGRMASVCATDAALYTTGPSRYLFDARNAGCNPLTNAALAVGGNVRNDAFIAERSQRALLLRDIFGNPFVPSPPLSPVSVRRIAMRLLAKCLRPANRAAG